MMSHRQDDRCPFDDKSAVACGVIMFWGRRPGSISPYFLSMMFLYFEFRVSFGVDTSLIFWKGDSWEMAKKSSRKIEYPA